MAEEHAGAFVRWERHIIGGLVGVVLMISAWMAVTLSDQTRDMARMDESIRGMKVELAYLRDTMKDRYTSGDAARDLGLRDAHIQDLRERVRRLEQRGEDGR